jgi:hypothetical protein
VSDHVKTLELWLDDLHRPSLPQPIADTIRAVLEENEHQLKVIKGHIRAHKLLGAVARDRGARIEAALAVLNPPGFLVTRIQAVRKAVNALRGEK